MDNFFWPDSIIRMKTQKDTENNGFKKLSIIHFPLSK